MSNVESGITPTFHEATVDMDSQLLTIPVQSAPESKIESDMEPPSRTPSLRSLDINPPADVAPALVVTDALTPKRAPLDFEDQDDYNSPAGLNRTHFSRPTYHRRRFKEPPRVVEGAVKERLAPFGQTATNMSFERFANNSFEKRGHPAPAVLTAMLQQRQNQAARSGRESSHPCGTTPNSFRDKPICSSNEEPSQQMVKSKEERKRSFIDNQHHQYETRTQQEWRSSTRSQWEERKLDENFNEVRSGDWADAKLRTESESAIPVDVQHQMDKLQNSRLSDQVFDDREVPVKRIELYNGSTPTRIYTTQQMQKGSIGGERPDHQLPVIGSQTPENLRKSQGPGNVPYRMDGEELCKPGRSTVISKEAVEQLRQSVVAESRLPSTPRRKTYESENEVPPPIDIKDLSMTDPVPRGSIAAQDAPYVTPTRAPRISVNMKSPSSLWSPTSRGWERRRFSSDREDSTPYKWQVPQVDTRKGNREPDARSNESRTSNCGSTVRRHVPRGRIRDLARLFDGLTREAQRESEVLRGKSLPPPKQRSKYFRTRSLPRPQDSMTRDDTQPPKQVAPFSSVPNEDHALKIPYTSAHSGIESHVSTANQPHLPSSQRNSCSEPAEAGEAPRFGMEWSRPQQHDNEARGDHDDASTDRDLASAFGRVPSIHSPESSAMYDTKHLGSAATGNYGNERMPTTSEPCEQRAGQNATHPEPAEHHYAEPVIMRTAPPPQRLSVIHPNSGQHGYYVQHRRVQSDQQPYRASVHVVPKPEPTYAKVQRVSANQHYPLISQQGTRRVESVSALPSERHFENVEAEKVTGEIDRMFEFVDEHDGLSTLGRETGSESVIGVVKHGDYGTVRGDDVGHLPELPPMPPQPPTPHNLDSTRRRSDQPLKYSISGYRDMQRIQRMGRVSSDAPPRFSPLTAPTPGIGVSTYKSREGTIGEKVSTISRYSRPNTQPSALATSTPVNSPLGTGLSQGPPEAPNLDDSFVSTITTASHLHDAHEEYKRQIAKLNHQIRVQEEQIEMTLKVLALARKKQKSMQELSAQRTLLLAHERLELLRCEVNRISALAAVRNPPPPVSRDLRGTMTISNITVHLNRSFCQRQYDHETSYALLILLKCGAEVEATGPISLLAHQPVRIRQLTFAEHVQFSNLPVDFNVVVEVYAMKLPTAKQMEQSCATNIANKCRNLLNPVSAHRPGRSAYRSDAQVSEFVRCGYIILNRDTVGANKFYLDEAEYPLEGIIEVYARCTTLPPAIEVDNRGFLTMYQTVSGMASWERYWAVLRRGMVYFWRYPDDESLEKRPVAFMDLSKCTNEEVMACSPEQCPRENSFSIDMLVSTTPSMMEKKRVLLSADSNELLHAWLQALNETLSVLRG
ncbi:PH domain protein [Ostertagia ostertagi]